MGIDTRHEDEHRGELARVPDPKSVFSGLLRSANLANTVCVQFIDPYGDAVFNQHQLPVLIDELQGLLSVAVNRETREHLASVVQLVEAAKGQVHTYVRFLGD
jgi:hypothetical protein